MGAAAGVTGQLSIVVSDVAEYEARQQLPPYRPFEVELVSGLVVRVRVLEVEHDPDSAVELKLVRLVGPRECPSGVDTWPVKTNDGIEAGFISTCRSHRLDVDGVREVAVRPAE